jgi:hypothetical protein
MADTIVERRDELRKGLSGLSDADAHQVIKLLFGCEEGADVNKHRRYRIEMAAAIIERGDDQLRDGFSGGGYTDAHQVIELLLGALGYDVSISEDGDVALLPEGGRDVLYYRDGVPCYEDGTVIGPDHFRVGQLNGVWYHHAEALYGAALGVSSDGHLTHEVKEKT